MTKIKLFTDFDALELVNQINEDKLEFFATQIIHTKDGWHAFAYYREEKGVKE